MSRFCLALVLAGWALTFGGRAVGADPEEGQHYRIKNVRSKLLLSVSEKDKEEGAMIVQAPQGANHLQQWKFVKVGDSDYYKIINRKTGMALNVQSESMEEGAPIIQWDASVDNENQQWSLVKKGEFFAIKARHSGMVLDVAEKREFSVVQFPLRKSNDNQIFELVPDKGKQ